MTPEQFDLWHYDFVHTAAKSIKAILDSLEEGNKSAMARRCNLPQPTISRIANMKVTPSLEVLETVASAYGFDAWQLLVPNFDPKSPPVLRYMNGAEESLYKKFKELRAELSHLDDK